MANRAPRLDAGARERILDAAKTLFAERGFDGSTTKAIAAKAGVPDGLIFYYFKTKAGVLETLLREESMLPRARSRVEALGGENPREVVMELGRLFLSAGRVDGRHFKILLRETGTNEKVKEEFYRLSSELLDLVTDEFERLLEGTDRKARVAARTFVFTTMFAGVFRPPIDPDRFLEETLEILLS